MSVESKAASIISKVGLWWPLAEEGQLRRAAGAYERVQAAALNAARAGTAGSRLVTGGGQSGPAVESFAAHWAQFDGGPQAGLPATAEAAASVAKALRQFAGEVSTAKHKIINLAIEIAASIAVGVALAIWTAGGSAAAAAVRTAMLVARGWLIAQGLTGVVGVILANALVGAAYFAVEGFITGIVAQVAKTVLSDGDGVNLGETMNWTAWGALSGFALVGAGGVVRTGFQSLKYGDNVIANRLGRFAGEAGDAVPAGPHVNPSGSKTNCVDCVIATEKTLAGEPTIAEHGIPKNLSIVQRTFGTRFERVSGREEIERLLIEAGPGARGIVTGGPVRGTPDGPFGPAMGHMVNAWNDNGTIVFWDGQVGASGARIFELGQRVYQFAFTHVP